MDGQLPSRFVTNPFVRSRHERDSFACLLHHFVYLSR
jgi:hypothetical protein